MSASAKRLGQRTALRYVLVGVLSFLIDFGILTLAYEVAGLPLWLASAAGFWCSVAANFLLQRAFTFRSESRSGPALTRYALLLGFNTVVNALVIELFERAGLGYAAGKVVVTGVQTVWNYFAYQRWVFGARRTCSRGGDRAGVPGDGLGSEEGRRHVGTSGSW